MVDFLHGELRDGIFEIHVSLSALQQGKQLFAYYFIWIQFGLFISKRLVNGSD
jgi:hypothetical protein